MKNAVITLREIINDLKFYKNTETCFVPPRLSGNYYKILKRSYFIERSLDDCVLLESEVAIKIINNIAHVFYHYNKDAEIELLECRPMKDIFVMSFNCYDYRISISVFLTKFGILEGEININNLYRHIISADHLKDRDMLNKTISESLVTYMVQYDSSKYNKELSLWNN